MKDEFHVYYDEEGDFLEIQIGPYTKSYCRDIDEGIYERVDEMTGEIKGFGILSFKKRTLARKEVDIKLPFKLAITA